MNWNSLLAAATGVVLAGCVTCQDRPDPVVGNWGLKLDYDTMSAGHLIVSRDADGAAQALLLWRWASPEKMNNVKLFGNRIVFDSPNGFRFNGFVMGDRMSAVAIGKNGLAQTTVEGWRNPENPKCPCASTKNIKLGAGIDLLKDGLAGWESMNPKAKFGWSIKEENGERVLSNFLGLKPDGKWAGGGANLKTKRADFYDFNLEYDVRVPKKSNSGVYLRGRYEIQVVDSYGAPVNCHNMGAYYGRVTPTVAAEKPAGEWQHVSVTLFRRHLTVVLNGQTIIDDVEVNGVTGGAIDANEFVPGPLYLQGDHSDADYKNMILRPAVN